MLHFMCLEDAWTVTNCAIVLRLTEIVIKVKINDNGNENFGKQIFNEQSNFCEKNKKTLSWQLLLHYPQKEYSGLSARP